MGMFATFVILGLNPDREATSSFLWNNLELYPITNYKLHQGKWNVGWVSC